MDTTANLRNEANGAGGNGNAPKANGQHQDMRELLPKLGLREYWYPALPARDVPRKQPVMLTMLGDDLCFFRGKEGQVVAVNNACPHRGAYLSKGRCEYKGTISCFYHGMVFDETGLCVAAFGEGPTSPMIGKLRAKVYPTATIKGVVWVWMGAGEPAPLEEGIWPLWVWAAGFVAGFFAPDAYLEQRLARRRSQVLMEIPVLCDMLTICTSAGLALERALNVVARQSGGLMAQELQQVGREVALGQRPLLESLDGMAERNGVPELSRFVSQLQAAHEQGIPVVQALSEQSEALREEKRQRVVAEGGRATVRMLLPVAAFILPVYFVVLLGPAVMQVVHLGD